jgi:hypothetical protein
MGTLGEISFPSLVLSEDSRVPCNESMDLVTSKVRIQIAKDKD